MSLTKQDLTSIRDVILEALDIAVNPRLDNLEDRVDKLEGHIQSLGRRVHILEIRLQNLETFQKTATHQQPLIEARLTDIGGSIDALHNDVVELYSLASKFNRVAHRLIPETRFKKLPAQQRILMVHVELLTLAQHLGISLPTRPYNAS